VQIRHVFQQAFRQDARKRRDVELDEVRQGGVEHILQGRAQRRGVPPDRKNAKPAQQVEIANAVAIVEVGTLPLLETDVVADCLEDADQLFVEMTRMQGAALRLALHEQTGNVQI